jgi:putative membrane protein
MTALVLCVLVALLHIYFLVLEMFLWDKPKGLKVFGHSLKEAKASKVLAANQGLYNGFLAAGIIYGLITGGEAGLQMRVFILGCVFIAGIYGGYSVNKRIFFIQSIPALLAIIFSYL